MPNQNEPIEPLPQLFEMLRELLVQGRITEKDWRDLYSLITKIRLLAEAEYQAQHRSIKGAEEATEAINNYLRRSKQVIAAVDLFAIKFIQMHTSNQFNEKSLAIYGFANTLLGISNNLLEEKLKQLEDDISNLPPINAKIPLAKFILDIKNYCLVEKLDEIENIKALREAFSAHLNYTKSKKEEFDQNLKRSDQLEAWQKFAIYFDNDIIHIPTLAEKLRRSAIKTSYTFFQHANSLFNRFFIRPGYDYNKVINQQLRRVLNHSEITTAYWLSLKKTQPLPHDVIININPYLAPKLKHYQELKCNLFNLRIPRSESELKEYEVAAKKMTDEFISEMKNKRQKELEEMQKRESKLSNTERKTSHITPST